MPVRMVRDRYTSVSLQTPDSPRTKPLPPVLLEGWYEVVGLLSLAATCRPLQIVHRLEYRVMYAIMSMRHLTFSKASSFHV